MCPTYVDDVIRQGLPLLATMEGLEEGIVLVRLFLEEDFSQKYHSCSGLQHRSGGNMPCMKMVDSLNVFFFTINCAAIVQTCVVLNSIKLNLMLVLLENSREKKSIHHIL